MEHLRGQCLCALMPIPSILKSVRWMCRKCFTMPQRDVHSDVLPKCRIEILLPAFYCHGLRMSVMNAPSCHRHKCSHRLLQHIVHGLTQMCFDDGSSFFQVIFLFFLFPQYAKDLWTNRLKISSNHSLVRRETRLRGGNRSEFFIGSTEGQPKCEDLPIVHKTHLPCINKDVLLGIPSQCCTLWH